MTTAQSMTGFAVYQAEFEGVELKIELRSLNSRFLDVNTKIPYEYYPFENDLRAVLKKYFERGRLEVYITRWSEVKVPQLSVNSSLFHAYWEKISQLAADINLGRENLSSAFSLLIGRSDIIQSRSDAIEDSEKKFLLMAMEESCSRLKAVRQSEGVHLQAELVKRSENLKKLALQIKSAVQNNFEKIKTNLNTRLAELLSNQSISADKLTEQAALIADRQDITEELVRISAHLQQFEALLKTAPIGKKTEFLLQELNREFNTVASKAAALEIQNFSVEAKLELEKMREQALNLE